MNLFGCGSKFYATSAPPYNVSLRYAENLLFAPLDGNRIKGAGGVFGHARRGLRE